MGFALLVMRSAIIRFLRVPRARNGAGGSAPLPDQGRAHDAMLPPRSGWTLRHLDGTLRALRTIRQLGAPAHAACWARDPALA
jgi:hypothetical protein